MGALVFMRRTMAEVEMFGGEVYIDLDGRNIGILGLDDVEIEVAPGRHHVKMYKSHKFETLIGFAESSVEVGEAERILVRYAPPLVISQPGHLVISEYAGALVEQLAAQREKSIKEEAEAEESRKESARAGSEQAVKFFLIITAATALIWFISWQMTIDAFKPPY